MAEFASKPPLAMPFVIKKKHKYRLFSASVSCARLRRVQDILKADGLDGILCVHGIDSRYNSGTKQLLNYLLFGYCDISAESISVRLTDEALEDLVIFIKHENVHIYCNPINYSLILPCVGHWRNLHFHCLAKEEDDEEKTEEFKILSFISMVKGCPKIGIPYGHDHLQKPFDAFAIEKWPLIQSFALEGFGGGGFFTMVHEITDVTSKLNTIYGFLDPVVAEILLTERLPLFERHCKSVLTNIDLESGVLNDLTKLTEDLVSEPVVSYYKHGHMSETSNNLSRVDDQPGPFVLFGVNTTKKILDEVKVRQNKGLLSSSGISGLSAKHMVFCATDPKGVLSCLRTYFFANGFLPYPYSDSTANLKIEDQSKDLRLMIDFYLIAVNAALEGILSFVQTQDLIEAKSVVDSTLKNGISKKNIPFGPNDVKFSIEAQDCLGREVESQNHSPSIYKASLYFYDIPSIDFPGTTIGSVAFGETFFKSAIKSLNEDGMIEWNCKHVVLTENVSRYASWMGEEAEKERTKLLEDFVKSKAEDITFGKQLISGCQCYVGGGTKYSKYEQGTLSVYEKGLIFIHPRYGGLVLPLAVIPRMQFYDGESSNTVALLILKYNPSLTSHLPPHLVNTNNMLVIALMPRTKIFRQFYSDVLPLWKNLSVSTIPTLEMLTDLPDDLHIMYLGLEEHNTVEVKGKHTVQHTMMSLADLNSFLAHLLVSSSGDIPVQTDDLAVVLGKPKQALNEEESNNLELLLIILTGVPGSGKDQLCDTLVKLAKDNSKWIILRSPMTHTLPFDAQDLQASLHNTLISQRKLLVRMSGRKRIRVVLVTPGFTDIIDVVQAIYSHPNPEVKKNIKIGAVTSCIDPDNMFMDQRYTLPKLLDQCAQGWVNNIVFTNCLDSQNDKLAMVQKLIRACNPEAAFILAKGGEVTRSPDVDLVLSDSAFMKESAVQKRHLMCPGWSLGVFNTGSAEPPISEICINLFGPLDKQQFVSKLRALQGPMDLKNCLTKGSIHSIRGDVHFLDHNTITEVHWSALRGSLTLNTVDISTIPRPPTKAAQNGDMDNYTLSCFVVFTGFCLKEDALRDWLRTCGKQMPQKKKLKTLKDLTQKELHQITANHKCDPLPEGWFYTGSTYVSLTGEKTFQHPLMDKFIQQYLTSINEGIIKHNSSIDAMPQVDIFKRT